MTDFKNPFGPGGAYGASSGMTVNNAAMVRRMNQSPEQAIERRLIYLDRQIAKLQAEKDALEKEYVQKKDEPKEAKPKKPVKAKKEK